MLHDRFLDRFYVPPKILPHQSPEELMIAELGAVKSRLVAGESEFLVLHVGDACYRDAARGVLILHADRLEVRLCGASFHFNFDK